VSLPVFTTPQAEAQIRTIHVWWKANRPAAPDLFAEELTHCLELLGQAPRIGKPYHRYSVRGLRRILLRATRYHVYYLARADAVTVLAIWHTGRGQRPPL
jgi:plasmid stabilization system protein ParE